MRLLLPLLILLPLAALAAAPSDAQVPNGAGKVLRAGMIGLDTSHVIAFTKLFNDPKVSGDLAGLRIVAGYPGGTDIPASRDRVEKFTQQLREMGIEIVSSIPALMEKVDVVLLESVDGRVHLEQARPVFEAKKPVFIDKPVAGSLADALRIYDLAKKSGTPCFSASSLRFAPAVQEALKDTKVGTIAGCDTWSPCTIEPSIPDLFFYGIHGIEMLYTAMGTGCETVTRAQTPDTDLVTGVWKDGRVGTFRGIRKNKADYGLVLFGSAGIVPAAGSFSGYEQLCVEIARFFKTGTPPVTPEETIELVAFMEAAEESKRKGGAPVSIAETLAKARKAARVE
jgi:hypothetical protein